MNIINNDLDTPKAIALLWELIKDDALSAGERKMTALEFDAVLGLGFDKDPEEILRSLGHIAPDALDPEIQALVEERQTARIAQNWAESDRLRDALSLKGYAVEDSPEGPKVSKL